MEQERELFLLRKFLLQAIENHPLPWEIDWDIEVVAANGGVLKCDTPEEARDIIRLAEEEEMYKKRAL